MVGGGLVVQNGFDIDKALQAIEQHGITNFYAVPTIYIRLLGLKNLKERLRTVRYCFSAASSMAMEVVREWHRRTGLKIHESYGLTESAAMVTYNHYYHHVVGSVGTPINLVEVEIRDKNGQPVPQGKKGEICIRGDNIFKGYLNNPEETAAAFWDANWFRSGDIGVIDEKGYLFIVDRLKDMIITGGENVYPREVEEILYTWSGICECAVVGSADWEYGERVTAYLVTQPGCTVDTTELKAFLKNQLPGYKVPKQFIVVNEIPKSSTGKLLKRELRKTDAHD
jgi:long-chain acyl-CoA synthetase